MAGTPGRDAGARLAGRLSGIACGRSAAHAPPRGRAPTAGGLRPGRRPSSRVVTRGGPPFATARASAGASGGPARLSRRWAPYGRVVASRGEARPVLAHRTWRGAAHASRGYEIAYDGVHTRCVQQLLRTYDTHHDLRVSPVLLCASYSEIPGDDASRAQYVHHRHAGGAKRRPHGSPREVGAGLIRGLTSAQSTCEPG